MAQEYIILTTQDTSFVKSHAKEMRIGALILTGIGIVCILAAAIVYFWPFRVPMKEMLVEIDRELQNDKLEEQTIHKIIDQIARKDILEASNASQLSKVLLIGGALIETLAIVLFFLYGNMMNQISTFLEAEGRAQRLVLTEDIRNSLIENISAGHTGYIITRAPTLGDAQDTNTPSSATPSPPPFTRGSSVG